MQSGVRQVSTSTISTASLEERASYQLKLLRHRPDTSGPCGAAFPCLTSSARRTRSGHGSKIGATRAVAGETFAGTEAGAGTSGWPAETQGCGLKQREPQPRGVRLPLNEARADWQAEPESKGPSLPLLPMPIFAQPEQYQSKEYVTAARVPAGSSKAKARTIARLTRPAPWRHRVFSLSTPRMGPTWFRRPSWTLLEYVLNLADDVSRRDESPGSAVAAVVAVVTQDKIVAIGYPARQAFRGLSTLLVERKRPRRRHDGRRFRLDEDRVLVLAEPFQILEGGIRAILANVIIDPPDLYLLIVDLEPLVVVRDPVTWKTDYPLRIAHACVYRVLENDDVSSLHRC
jgi:hypothetical protein